MYDTAVNLHAAKEIHEHARALVAKSRGGDGSSPDTRPKSAAKGKQKIQVSPMRSQVNPQKPLVKMPSVDSGYSSQSQRSGNNGGKKTGNSREGLQSPEDANADDVQEGKGITFKDGQSALEFKKKNPMIKQDSMGTVRDWMLFSFYLFFSFFFFVFQNVQHFDVALFLPQNSLKFSYFSLQN